MIYQKRTWRCSIAMFDYQRLIRILRLYHRFIIVLSSFHWFQLRSSACHDRDTWQMGSRLRRCAPRHHGQHGAMMFFHKTGIRKKDLNTNRDNNLFFECLLYIYLYIYIYQKNINYMSIFARSFYSISTISIGLSLKHIMHG